MCKTYHSLMHTPLHKRSPNSSISQPRHLQMATIWPSAHEHEGRLEHSRNPSATHRERRQHAGQLNLHHRDE